MASPLAPDPDRAGFALFRPAAARDGPLAISIRFLDGTYLGPAGQRTRERHIFPLDARGPAGPYVLGPAITAHVLEAEVVTLADQNGVALGTASWDGIRPPPDAGHGALIGGARAQPTPALAPPAPPVSRRGERPASVIATTPAPAAPQGEEPVPAPEPVGAAGPAAGRRRGIMAGTALLAALVLVSAGFVAMVLSGRLGWAVEPAGLSFDKRARGAIEPRAGTVRLRALWYARPLAPFVPQPFVTDGGPPWLVLRQAKDGADWILEAAPGDDVPAGDHAIRVGIVFPLGGTGAGRAVAIELHIAQPPAHSEPARSLVDDAACDRVAGSRFDPDHPDRHPFVDEIFDTAAVEIENGLAWCDARTDRVGADRRFVVQHGRLLAARAQRRAAQGDLAGARQDMDAALADWRAGSAQGSAFADSLLGAYAFGSFNRPTIVFVEPDDAQAATSWRRGMMRGSVVAQRNYAAQLLGGRGVDADPARAIALLRDALGRGDERAAGVLGVALYTGYPPGVALDKSEGWALIGRAQCVDKPSGDLLAAEIARGAHPPGDRRACP